MTSRTTLFSSLATLALLAIAPPLARAQQVAAPSPAQSPVAWDTYSDTWVGVDALGRALPTYEQVGGPRGNKQVGIFYYLWLGSGHDNGPYDVSKILAADPDARNHPDSPLWGGVPGFHYWGEPLFGYYSMEDRAILRKHVQMLNDAGVDMLLFDVSNGYLYEKDLATLIEMYHQIRAEGQKTPLLAFHVVAGDGDKLVKEVGALYDAVYADPKNDDLWFRWKGKPLIVGTPVPGLGPKLLDYFTFRKSYWNGRHPGPGSWNTDGYYPTENPGEIMRDEHGMVEQMGAAVASSIVHSPISSEGPGDGRDWHLGVKTGRHIDEPGAVNRGIQYQDNWDFDLKFDPAFVLIYDWNEWIAQRFLNKGANTTYLVDEFDPEFSKDIEPMRGGFGDDYYYQTVANVRRYTGVRKLPPVTPRPIRLSGPFSQWNAVRPEFRDDIGDPVHRDAPGWSKTLRYVNSTGRNDLVASKVSYDTSNVYFYVRTREKLTPRTDPNWMLLFLNTDADYKTGWLGYDFVVNRKVGAQKTTLERHVGGAGEYKWETIADLSYRVSGNEMMIVVPRSLLGIRALPVTVDFKWADNCISSEPGWADFTLNGDAAPNDRFNYRAKLLPK